MVSYLHKYGSRKTSMCVRHSPVSWIKHIILQVCPLPLFWVHLWTPCKQEMPPMDCSGHTFWTPVQVPQALLRAVSAHRHSVPERETHDKWHVIIINNSDSTAHLIIIIITDLIINIWITALVKFYSWLVVDYFSLTTSLMIVQNGFIRVLFI